jgi:Ca-activated chloride channel family protein
VPCAIARRASSSTATSAPPISRTYPRQLTDLFQGEQLVWVGRYKYGGAVKVTLTGAVAGERRTFTFPATLAEKSFEESNGFVEKLWATRRVGEIINEIDLRGHNQELVDELVQLSMRHGIITPYTSFLADENVTFADRRELFRRSGEALNLGLQKVDGLSGVSQRDYKGNLQLADQPASAPAGSVGGFGGGGRGGRGRGAGGPAPAEEERLRSLLARSAGRATVSQDAEGKVQVVDSVRNIGQKSFFFKNSQWQESTITPEQAKQAIRVVQFSDDYFELAAKHGGTLAKYLAFDEPLLVNLAGQVYMIAPPPPEGGN